MPRDESSVLREPPAVEGAATKVIRPSGFIPRPIPSHPEADWPCVRGYEILSVIGSGGMGIVYKAQQRELRRTVALKMLRGATLADPDFHVRLQAEAEAVARLQHPNIIQLFEIGTVEPCAGEAQCRPFISLEFVDGGSLTQRTFRPQTPRYAAEMVEKLARAVHSAHRLGVVHRDLKPANVLLTRTGEPKIADFGLAKQLGAERDDGGRFLTQAGTVVGTPQYMAPEQTRGDAPTAAIDIYALGVILYELLTARVPFNAASAIETMNALQHQEPVPPRQLQPGLPRDLETICLKCLEKDPAKRYASADALADDLGNFLDDRPIQARRITDIEKLGRWCRRNPLVAASLAGVVGIFLVAFVLVSRSYWRAEAAWQQEAEQRHKAERKEKAERRERYRANIVAAATALQIFNVGSARRTLEDTPEEYRNWEWRHFQSRLDLAQHVLPSDDVPVTGARIAANGQRAVLFGDNGFVRVWDTTTRREVRAFRDSPELANATVSPDGKTLAGVVKDHAIVLRDIDTGRVIAYLRGHEKQAHSFNFTADGKRLVTASNEKTVRVWDTATGEALRVIHVHAKGVANMRISPDGRRVATGDQSRTNGSLWDLDTGNKIADLPGHDCGMHGIDFNQKGDRFVSTQRFPSNDLRLWNAETGQLIAVMGRHSNRLTGIAFNSAGTRIASSSMDQTVMLWDGATGQALATLKGHNGQVHCVAFSPNGKRLISASQDHTIRLWDGDSGESLAVLTGHTASVIAAAFSADGSRIVSASSDGSVRIWDVSMVENHGILRGHGAFVYSVAFSPDSERVVTAGWDGAVRIWDATTGTQQSGLDHGKNMIAVSVAMHPAGRMIATRVRKIESHANDAVVLWDLETGQELQRWHAPAHMWKDSRVAFSPNGDLLASGCDGGEVRLWDMHTRKETAILRGHKDEIRDVAFSPDGKLLATAGEAADKTIRIWDVARKEQVHLLEGHKDCVYTLAFSPDGKLLASGSTDRTTRLWDTATWREITALKQGTNVYGVAFTPDGSRLACAGADNSIHFWDVATHQEVAELRGHGDYVHAIAFSRDGARLASASGDFTARVWDTVRPQDRTRGQ
jgi:WD40 repeat protein